MLVSPYYHYQSREASRHTSLFTSSPTAEFNAPYNASGWLHSPPAQPPRSRATRESSPIFVFAPTQHLSMANHQQAAEHMAPPRVRRSENPSNYVPNSSACHTERGCRLGTSEKTTQRISYPCLAGSRGPDVATSKPTRRSTWPASSFLHTMIRNPWDSASSGSEGRPCGAGGSKPALAFEELGYTKRVVVSMACWVCTGCAGSHGCVPDRHGSRTLEESGQSLIAGSGRIGTSASSPTCWRPHAGAHTLAPTRAPS